MVEYGYANGSANTIRMTSMTYPDGRVLDYDYGSSGSQTDRLDRVATIDDGAQTLVEYDYTGGGQVVTQTYQEPGIERTLALGSGSDPYSALGRFGRMIDLRWSKGASDLVSFEYDYDRSSNRLFERNLVDGSGGSNRRVIKTLYSSGSASETRHVYYSTSSQVLEERLGSSSASSQQFVWNLGYVDDLVLRDRDTTSNGTLDERLYSLRDLRYSVMALANSSGMIVERFSYEAYGRSSALQVCSPPDPVRVTTGSSDTQEEVRVSSQICCFSGPGITLRKLGDSSHVIHWDLRMGCHSIGHILYRGGWIQRARTSS